MNRFIFATIVLPLLSAAALAHPLPNMRFDRTVHVRLTATGVTVKYSLELNDWTMVLDGKNLVSAEETKDVAGQRAFAQVYARKKAPLIADNLRSTVNGTNLTFRQFGKTELEPERDHLQLRFQFRADWPQGGGKQSFAFEDQNFEDRSGQSFLTLDKSGEGLTLISSDDPADLRGKSPLDYKPGDEKRARQASAVFELANAPPPPAPSQPSKPQPEATAPSVEVVGAPKPLFEDIRDRGLVAFFDSNVGFGVMLLLSAVFGIAHAFTPGHGKTMVAAYLVGERGTVRHAVVLGCVATAAHTGSVILLAAVTYAVYGNEPPKDAQGWLTIIGGLLIAGVGLWLFLQRVRGRADHVHLFSDHHHHHDHEHGHAHGHHHDHNHDHHHGPPPEAAKTEFGWMRVILLGLGGGIIPCWDAVLLFLAALTRGKVGLAIPLLIAFSAGLASVLVGLGIGVVYANRAGGRQFGERKWFKLLPVLSAILLMCLGVWFARDGWHALGANPDEEVNGRP
ncbi:nickel/cobalt transporter [Fimbriiglobus ruber]|uniref:Nickel/cobalt efflux system n=1 Tax=Fimbriiglobus ruber TaxID=1908690 RepID=A0A225DRZ7_9BACT|nr:lysylphosphatidylglycerol synthase domain-containing protein [Fimbriiglobus ruber]OWK43823.1 hypothetical protein FRUB_03422 [Fimbriiglobus ruber]